MCLPEAVKFIIIVKSDEEVGGGLAEGCILQVDCHLESRTDALHLRRKHYKMNKNAVSPWSY